MPLLRDQPGLGMALKAGHSGRTPLAFTVAPQLQIINHRGCFSPFAGI
jgi:hypothetical protein